MGSDVENNLCLRCLRCNLKKGPNIASIDPAVESEYRLVALFHPRKQRWAEHFHLREDGHIEGVTPEGRATVRLLDFNAELDFIHLVIEQCQQTPSAVIYETSFWRSIRNRDIQKLPLFENQELMPDGSSVLRAWIKSS
jgi:hypothetical protein